MILLKNIYKSFDKKSVIEGINLEIPKGEKAAIIGASGCGKSTLLRIIMGLQPVTSGEVWINKTPVHNASSDELSKLREKFGMLFQSAALFDSMTVEENVGFILRENTHLKANTIKKRVEETLELVEMKGYEKAMPSDLSGGQRKRIGLARAIIHKPEIVLYDEPTTGLDPVLSTNIENLIVKLNNQMNMTSIIVTHQISTILRTADSIYMMENKSLLPPENPENIKNSENPSYKHFINGGLI